MAAAAAPAEPALEPAAEPAPEPPPEPTSEPPVEPTPAPGSEAAGPSAAVGDAADLLPPLLPPTLPTAAVPPPPATPPPATPPPATPPPATPPPVPAPTGSIFAALGVVDPGLGTLAGDLAAAQTEIARVRQAVLELERARSAAQRDEPAIRELEVRVQQAQRLLAQRSQRLAQQASRATPRSPQAEVVIRDAMTVTSVSLRLAMEAAALATVAVAEAVTLATQAPGAWVRQVGGAVELMRDAPVRVRSIAAELDAVTVVVRGLLTGLAQPRGIDPKDTVGFAYRGQLVAEVARSVWDSVHVEANAGGELFFYDAMEREGNSSGDTTYDYTNRVYKLRYHVDPIALASARLSASVDGSRIADLVGLNLNYATNRMYKSGGDIQEGSLAAELGIKSAWSDALDAALLVAGVKASVRIAQFTSGTVDLVQIADDSTIATFPFAFKLRQINLGYDFARHLEPPLRALTLSVGYFDYTLPRVLYEFENVTPDTDTATYVYARESPPQAVRSRFAMVGIGAESEWPLVGRLLGVFGVRGALGGGPISYYFLEDEALPDEESNRDRTERSTTGIDAGATLGVRYRFTRPDTRLSLHFDAAYQALFIVSEVVSKESATAVNSGSTDIFHGPTASLGGAF